MGQLLSAFIRLYSVKITYVIWYHHRVFICHCHDDVSRCFDNFKIIEHIYSILSLRFQMVRFQGLA